LFHGLKEELLDVRSLVQNHLGKGFQVNALFHFKLRGFGQRLQLFVLLFDDLLILEFDQLTLLFEVLNNLSKRGLEQVNFSFEHLDLLVLFELLHCDLLVGLHFLTKLVLQLLVLVREGIRFFLEVFQFVLLDQSFLLETIVLSLDVALNLRDVLLGIRLGLGFEILELFGKVIFNTFLLGLHFRLTITFQGIQFHLEHLVSVFFIFKRLDTHLFRIFELVESSKV
jgi:hypothetical protein